MPTETATLAELAEFAKRTLREWTDGLPWEPLAAGKYQRESMGRYAEMQRTVAARFPDHPNVPKLAEDIHEALCEVFGAIVRRELDALSSATLRCSRCIEQIEWFRDVDRAEQTADRDAARHGPDFRSVDWYGTSYTFTPMQADCVRVLWEAWQNGTPDVAKDTLLEACDSQQAPANRKLRIDVLFRTSEAKQHPAWKTMIVPGETNGTYRLATPK